MSILSRFGDRQKNPMLALAVAISALRKSLDKHVNTLQDGVPATKSTSLVLANCSQSFALLHLISVSKGSPKESPHLFYACRVVLDQLLTEFTPTQEFIDGIKYTCGRLICPIQHMDNLLVDFLAQLLEKLSFLHLELRNAAFSRVLCETPELNGVDEALKEAICSILENSSQTLVREFIHFAIQKEICNDQVKLMVLEICARVSFPFPEGDACFKIVLDRLIGTSDSVVGKSLLFEIWKGLGGTGLNHALGSMQ